MTHQDYLNLIEFAYVGGGYLPHNERAKELSENKVKGEIVAFKEAKQRDLKFHKCYFLLLSFIYDYLPNNFKEQIPKDKFYKWLQHLKGEYTVNFTFKDGTTFIEYDSISFGRMSQETFKNHIKSQLPWIYANVIGAFYDGDIYTGIIETIEIEYEKFLAKL